MAYTKGVGSCLGQAIKCVFCLRYKQHVRVIIHCSEVYNERSNSVNINALTNMVRIQTPQHNQISHWNLANWLHRLFVLLLWWIDKQKNFMQRQGF